MGVAYGHNSLVSSYEQVNYNIGKYRIFLPWGDYILATYKYYFPSYWY